MQVYFTQNLLQLDELVVIFHIHDATNESHSRKRCLLLVVRGRQMCAEGDDACFSGRNIFHRFGLVFHQISHSFMKYGPITAIRDIHTCRNTNTSKHCTAIVSVSRGKGGCSQIRSPQQLGQVNDIDISSKPLDSNARAEHTLCARLTTFRKFN